MHSRTCTTRRRSRQPWRLSRPCRQHLQCSHSLPRECPNVVWFDLDKNYVCGQMLLAGGLSQVGRVEEAVRVGERALSFKALPSDDRCLSGVAAAYALAGALEEAAV